jgi:hypothetical protein
MKNKKEIIGLDLVDYVPDYTKSLEENTKIYRQKYFEVYGEYPPVKPKHRNPWTSNIEYFSLLGDRKANYPRRKITIRRRTA